MNWKDWLKIGIIFILAVILSLYLPTFIDKIFFDIFDMFSIIPIIICYGLIFIIASILILRIIRNNKEEKWKKRIN